MRVALVLVLAFGLVALCAPALAAAGGAKAPAAPANAKLVNINTASAEELVSLPGIGPALAKRIVEHRQAHGPFNKVDDLQAVKGIGPKLLGRIRDRLTVGETKDAR